MNDYRLETKFGRTRLHNGYLEITTRKEGNHLKRLHRLIYEDYYGVTILPWVHIHHKDGNRLNNNITNLQALTKSEHPSMHRKVDQFGEDNPYYRHDLHSKELYEAYLRLGSFPKVAKEFNTHATTVEARVKKYCSDNNIEFKKQRNATSRPDLDTKELYEVYQELGNYSAVARKYNCSPNTVKYRLNKYKQKEEL